MTTCTYYAILEKKMSFPFGSHIRFEVMFPDFEGIDCRSMYMHTERKAYCESLREAVVKLDVRVQTILSKGQVLPQPTPMEQIVIGENQFVVPITALV